MSSKLKDLTGEVTKALDKVLPSNVHCVFVLLDAENNDAATASDLSDEGTLWLLKDAAKTLEEARDLQELEKAPTNKMTN